MPSAMRNIVKSVLEYIKENNLKPTPEVYREIFCEKAQEFGFKVTECDRLSSLAQKLTDEEQAELMSINVTDVDSLFDFVVNKLRQKEQDMLGNGGIILSEMTLEKIASLMLASLMPAYSDSGFNKNVQELQQELHNHPELIKDEHFQENIKYLIEKRIDLDQQTISEKTNKMSALIHKISSFIDNTVTENSNSTNELLTITSELASIAYEDFDNTTFDNFKNGLIHISDKMQNQMNGLSKKLIEEQNEVTILKEKIKALESNLQDAQFESRTDFLTGVLTRRAMDMELQLLERNFQSKNINYHVIFIDLDNFKMINDKYGHDAGDVVLSTFSKLLLKKAPMGTLIGRYGGEEFIVVVEESSTQDCEKFLLEVNEFIHKTKFVYSEISLKVTFSAGVVGRVKYDSLENTIKTADKLLYKAKHLGKDRVEIEE